MDKHLIGGSVDCRIGPMQDYEVLRQAEDNSEPAADGILDGHVVGYPPDRSS
jgi:hypothetical protein